MKPLEYIFLIVFFTTLGAVNLYTQWKQTTGPWTEVTFSFAGNDTMLYAGTYSGGVFRSSDYGNSWTEIDGGHFPFDTGFTRMNIKALVLTSVGTGEMNIMAGSEGRGIFLTTNNGTTWAATNNGLTNLNVRALVVNDTTILAGTAGGVYRSTDNGESWMQDSTELRGYWAFVVGHTSSGDTILIKIASGSGVLRSTDNGTTWLPIYSGLPGNAKVIALAFQDSVFYAGTGGYGVYYSIDGGLNWIKSGGPNNIYSLGVCGQYLFAGVSSPTIFTGSVWRRPLSEMVTGIEGGNEKIPTIFILEQNYPNPFNPTTAITYQLSTSGHVVLKVYDVLGREIETLISAHQSTGVYKVGWHASDISGGIYYYRLTTNNVSETKKMLLQK